MGPIDIRDIGAFKLGLISLGVALAIVLTSYFWWVDAGAAQNTGVVSEGHGFPIHYYTIITSQIGVYTDPEYPTLAVDIAGIFVICFGILALWRWRTLGTPRRRRV